MTRATLNALLCAAAIQSGCAAFVGYTPAPTQRPLPSSLRARRAPSQATLSLSEARSEAVGSAVGETRSVSLSEVVVRAREHAYAVIEAAADVDAASGRAQSAAGALLPGASLEAGGGYLNGRQIGSFGEVRDDLAFGRFEPSVGIFYRVNPGAEVARTTGARHEVDAAALSMQDAQRVAALQAGIGYFDLALAHTSVQIASQLVQDSERFVGIAQARAKAEIGSGADVARAEADAARAKQALIRARGRWQAASVRLAVLLRWPPNKLLLPSENKLRPHALIDARASDALVAEAERARPDVGAARARALASESRSSAAFWDLLGPEIDVSVRERLIGTTVGDLGPTTLAHAFVGLSFDFGAVGHLRTARAEARGTALRAKVLVDQVRGEIATALAKVRVAEAVLPEAERAMEETERSYQTELARFQAGTGLGIEVIEAQNARARARQDLAEAIVRYNAAEVELAASAGHLSSDLWPAPTHATGAGAGHPRP